jgi:DNA-binding CsgD family transcriptional regulator
LDVEFLKSESSVATLDHRVNDLVGAIGSPTFESSMLEFAAKEVRCSHMTAFARYQHRPPRVILAIDRDKAHVARRIAAKYLKDYWELDPANRAIRIEPRLAGGATVRLRCEEIENNAYRRDCYGSVRLVDRFSIIKSQSKDVVRLNFYRDNTRGRFSDGELIHLSKLASLLVQIVMKHDQFRPYLSDEDRYGLYCRRLSAFAPSLSLREIEVCAEIVLGRNSEGIAAKMGLSINTILSHRKHAYSKLSISSQNELSRLVLQ